MTAGKSHIEFGSRLMAWLILQVCEQPVHLLDDRRHLPGIALLSGLLPEFTPALRICLVEADSESVDCHENPLRQSFANANGHPAAEKVYRHWQRRADLSDYLVRKSRLAWTVFRSVPPCISVSRFQIPYDSRHPVSVRAWRPQLRLVVRTNVNDHALPKLVKIAHFHATLGESQ